MLSRKAFLLILSAPSGTGKTTLCRALLRHDSNLGYSVSATTRPRRGKEVDGEDYHFITDERFDNLIKESGFLEWEEVYGHRYGTLRSEIERSQSSGRDVILDLDVKGALHVRQVYPGSVAVFLLPPTIEELRHRLLTRGREGKELIEERLKEARSEIEKAREFDYVIVNDSLAESVHKLTAILEAERARSKKISEIKLNGG